MRFHWKIGWLVVSVHAYAVWHMYTEIAERMLTPEELEEMTRQEEEEDGE